MNDTTRIIIESVGGLLITFIGFLLGRWAERQKQVSRLHSEELKVIEEWLAGAERLVSILSDTLAAISQNLTTPILYDFDERRSANQFLSEKTNVILSIVDSKEFQTRKTKKLAKELLEVLKEIDILLKHRLLPTENMIVKFANENKLSELDIFQGIKIKTDADELFQKAYKIIRNIRIKLT